MPEAKKFNKNMEKKEALTEEKKEQTAPMLDAFFRIHDFLVAHSFMPIRRQLMDEINWDHRLIAIKGGRGVGKTDFLLVRLAVDFLLRQNRLAVGHIPLVVALLIPHPRHLHLRLCP